jgi:peroxiredoxin (alkyl hydroperoxide reductase subunit C)
VAGRLLNPVWRGSEMIEQGQEYRMPLIGEPAPSFTAVTTQGDISFPADFKGKWVVLFSHPADFTPVCTTEFMIFAAREKEFRDLDAQLIGLSTDSTFSHIAWLRTIREKIEYADLREVEVRFPVIADTTMEVSRLYGMLHPQASATHTIRAVFMIDPDSVIQAILYYPQSVGRDVLEIKRLLEALRRNRSHQVVTPADWRPGQEVIMPAPASVSAAQERISRAGADYRCVDWFLCFRKDPGK